MSPYYPGKEAKADNSLPIFVFQTLVVDKPNSLCHHRPEKLLVIGLQLFGMRKKQIGLMLDQLGGRDFFYAKEVITARKIFLQGYPCRLVFFVTVTASNRGLHHHLNLPKCLLKPLTLCRRKRHPAIGRIFTLAQQSDLDHRHTFATRVKSNLIWPVLQHELFWTIWDSHTIAGRCKAT